MVARKKLILSIVCWKITNFIKESQQKHRFCYMSAKECKFSPGLCKKMWIIPKNHKCCQKINEKNANVVKKSWKSSKFHQSWKKPTKFGQRSRKTENYILCHKKTQISSKGREEITNFAQRSQRNSQILLKD